MSRRASVLALVLALFLAIQGGCQGIPIGDHRYSASQEASEVVLGTFLLPFAFAGDVIVGYFLLGDPFSWTEFACALISPFHNALGGETPTEVPELPAAVAVTRARRGGELRGGPREVRAEVIALLMADGWQVERDPDDRYKLITAWRLVELPAPAPSGFRRPAPPAAPAKPGAKPAAPEPLRYAQRLRVRIYRGDRSSDRARVRARLELGGSIHLVDPARFAAEAEQLAELERRLDAAEDALEDAEDEADLIEYYSHGERGKDEYLDELERARAPHRDDVEDLTEDIRELEDELYRQQAAATRELLQQLSDEPLRALWMRLTTRFPELPPAVAPPAPPVTPAPPAPRRRWGR